MRRIGAIIVVALALTTVTWPTTANGEDPPAHDSRAQVDVREVYANGIASAGELRAASAPCPDVITSSYRLTSDLACTLRVNATNATIDLGGHTLTGAIFGHSQGGAPGLTIRNGTLRAPASLANSMAIVNYTQTTIDKVLVTGYTSFAVQIGGGSIVKRSRFVGNEVGLDLYWGGSIRVTDSTFVGNGVGVLNGGDANTVIKRNVFEENQSGVVVWDEDQQPLASSSVRVEENQFRKNRIGLAVTAFEGVENLQVLRNRFVYNRGSAIHVSLCLVDPFDLVSCGGEDMAITHNVLFRNGHGGDAQLNDGLTVTGPDEGRANVTVTGTTADHNADLGIDAAGVVDGGGNRAVRNGNGQQCIGVVCG